MVFSFSHVGRRRAIGPIRSKLHSTSEISTPMARHASCGCNHDLFNHRQFRSPGTLEIPTSMASPQQILSQRPRLPSRSERDRKRVLSSAGKAPLWQHACLVVHWHQM